MNENKPRRLSEIIDSYAPQGANDRRWFLVEHQLEQVRLSTGTLLNTLADIIAYPENEGERDVADDCYVTLSEMRVRILGYRATVLSYLSDTDVPERISRKEL